MTTWTKKQHDILREYTDLTNEDLVELVALHGPEKSAGAIDRRRRDLGLRRVRDTDPNRQRAGRASALARAGWPEMCGSDEERDRAFQRRAIREAFRLGLISLERAA